MSFHSSSAFLWLCISAAILYPLFPFSFPGVTETYLIGDAPGSFCLCPFGKSSFAHLARQGHRPRAPYYAHGAEIHRRREGTVLVQLVGTWKLVKAGYSHAVSLHDGTHAFGCTPHTSLTDEYTQIHKFDDTVLFDQRLEHGAVTVVACDGAVTFSPKRGSMMGDVSAPKEFNFVSWQPIEEWQTALEDIDESHTLLECTDPVSGEDVDLGLTLIVDDIARQHVAPTALAFREHLGQANQILDTALHKYDYGQNVSKQDVLLRFVGRGAHAQIRAITNGNVVLPGKVQVEARYLGSRYHEHLSNHTERIKRITAIRKGYGTVGKAWYAGLNYTLIRILFSGIVQNAGLFVLVAFVWTDSDCVILDRELLKYLRKLMRGKATMRASADEEIDESGVPLPHSGWGKLSKGGTDCSSLYLSCGAAVEPLSTLRLARCRGGGGKVRLWRLSSMHLCPTMRSSSAGALPPQR